MMLHAQSKNVPRPQVAVPILGVKVETVQFTADNEQAAKFRAELKQKNMCVLCDPRPRGAIRGVAVQESRRAFYAGIFRGDIITHFGRWDNLAAEHVASIVAANYRPGQGMDLTVFYSLEGSPYPLWTPVSLTLSEPGRHPGAHRDSA